MSNLNEFINQCWADHDKKSEDVAKNLAENLALLTDAEQIPGYVAITVHTYGGHLGNWSGAEKVLKDMLETKAGREHEAIYRGLATLAFCAEDQESFISYSEKCLEEGSMVRVYAVAASQLAGQSMTSLASEAFKKALGEAPPEITKDHPAARALAISGNNLAAELEEKAEQSPEEKSLMIEAAKAGRKYWEIAGTWVEVERAEYRLAMSYLKAGELEKSLTHARLCESICVENQADEFEKFFAYEALTKVNRAFCEDLKSKVKPEWQQYCVIP